MTDPSVELLALTQRLLDCIQAADWETYEQLCDPTLTAFEPEAAGQLIGGLPFHKYYFDLGPSKAPRQTSICGPHVRVMGDVAIVSYVRLTQKLDEAGRPVTASTMETRVWQKVSGTWKHVHFHRS